MGSNFKKGLILCAFLSNADCVVHILACKCACRIFLCVWLVCGCLCEPHLSCANEQIGSVMRVGPGVCQRAIITNAWPLFALLHFNKTLLSIKIPLTWPATETLKTHFPNACPGLCPNEWKQIWWYLLSVLMKEEHYTILILMAGKVTNPSRLATVLD